MRHAHGSRRIASRRARGSVLIEVTLLMAFLVALGLGTVEIARAMQAYNTLTKGVRDGVRLLSTTAPGDAAALGRAQCLVVFGNTGCAGNPLVPGLTVGMVTVCDAQSCAGDHRLQSTGSGVVNLVTVRVAGYRYVPMTTAVVTNAIPFNQIRATMRQSL